MSLPSEHLYSPEAEGLLVSAALRGAEATLEAAETVQAGDFHDLACRKIFGALIRLVSRGEPVDQATVIEELQSEGDLELVGGVDGLYSIAQLNFTTAYIPKHAEIVANKAMKRRMIQACEQTIREAMDPTQDSRELLEAAERRVYEVAHLRSGDRVDNLHRLIPRVLQAVEDRANSPNKLRGLSTGFSMVDARTGGLGAGELIVVAGRPGMGKTAFALNVARNIVMADTPGGFFSLEMSSEELGERMIASEAGVESSKVRVGDLSSDQLRRVSQAASRLHTKNLLVDDTGGLSVLEVRAKARRMKTQHNIGFVVLDYLQLMSGAKGMGSREQEVSDISRNLKAMAKELEIPVISLSQLSRKPVDRPDKRPVLSDLRESGAIEQDADVVMFLHRPGYYSQDEEDQEAEVIIAKQRNGPVCTVPMFFDAKFLRFRTVHF